MKPIGFDFFAEDVELVLKQLLVQFNLKVISKDNSSFYAQNTNGSAIWIYYEGSSLQFVYVDSYQRSHHIYEILSRKGLSHLIPVKIDPNCWEYFKMKYPDFKYGYYFNDLCWLKGVGIILINHCKEELLG